MAPRHITKYDPDAWWKNAWSTHEHIHATFEIEFGKDIIKPGTIIKIKNERGTFKFRCLVHNSHLDVSWIDCFDTTTQQYRAFDVHRLKGIVKPKKSRRKKPNA